MKYKSDRYYSDYKLFNHTYEYKGVEKKKRYVVRRDGTVENEDTGHPMKKHIRQKKLLNGKIITQVQIRLPGKFHNYARVVAAAWYPFFDIKDLNQVVKHRNGNQFDFRPLNLYVTERTFNTKFLTEMQRRAIKWIRENERGRFGRKPSYRAIARLYKVSPATIMKVIKDTY